MQNDNVKFKVFFIFAIFLAILLLPKISKAATFYVDGNLSANCTAGNYSITNRACNGTDGNAYKTVKGGATVLSSGDTMYIRSGTYDENTINLPPGFTSMATISGYQNEWPIMRNNGDITISAQTYFRLQGDVKNITFTKLEFTGTYGRGDYNGNEQWAFQGTATDDRNLIVIDNNYFHDEACFIGGNMKYWIKNNRFKTFGSTPTNSSSAIYIGSGLGTNLDGYRTSWNDATIIENNYFENSRYNGTLVGSAIDIHRGDTGDEMIYHIIRNNIFNGDFFWAIYLKGTHAKVYNNSARFASGSQIFFGPSSGYNNCQSNQDIEVENNIAIGMNSFLTCGGCYDGNSWYCNGVVIKNNIADISSVYWNTCNNCTVSGNQVNTDPKFLSASPTTWTDFRLQSNSPAINAGLGLATGDQNVFDPNYSSWPPITVDQNILGFAWEIGAFAYRTTSSDTTPPTVPANLSAIAISSSEISLAWNASSDNVGVQGYSIFRNGVQIGSSVTTSYTDTGLSASTAYSYTVAAYDAAGNRSSQSLPSSATTQAPSIISGLVGYWKFDETSGNTSFDSSGNNNNATLVNGPVWTSGKVNGALSFNGTASYVKTNNITFPNNKITIAAWVNETDRLVNYPGIITYSDNYPFTGFGSRDTTNDLVSYTLYLAGEQSNDTGRCTINMPRNTWTHLVITYDGSQVKCYQNGSLVNTPPIIDVGTVVQDIPNFYFGSRVGSGPYFKGMLDEIRVYNRALSPADVSLLYNYTSSDTTPPSAPTGVTVN